MLHPLHNQDVQLFISKNLDTDLYKLLMQKSPFEDVSMKEIVQQIIGLKISRTKYPFLLAYPDYIYPPKVSLEQASSEMTAEYKSTLVYGSSIADLTGGMGIDTYVIGRNFDKCTYVERNEQLFGNTMANFCTLRWKDVTGKNTNAESFLETNTEHFDWLYIDPSRRIDGNRKISIENYEPNVVTLKDKMLTTSEKILIKLSPMQDITECVNVMQNIEKIWIISIKNDVKELLLQVGQAPIINPDIIVTDLGDTISEIKHQYHDQAMKIETDTIGQYIYQPAPAVVKSGLQNIHAKSRQLKKAHNNTQLFTSDSLVSDYFGRTFALISTLPSNPKEIKNRLPEMKANVITKNYPLSPQQLSKKLKISDGGDKYILAFTDQNDKKVICLCSRLS